MSIPNDYTQIEEEFKVETVSWTVPNLKHMLQQQVYKTISAEKSENLTASFELKLRFPRHKDDIFEIYYISLNPVYLKCNLTISTGLSSNRPLVKFDKDLHMLQANKWQYLGTVLIKRLINISSPSIINCEFQYKIFPEDIVNHYNTPEVGLINDFEHLLNDNLFSDVTMKSADGIEYKVHKVILASKSLVLRAHFEHNTTECYNNTIESPFEADLLLDVLKYIYSYNTSKVNEIPEKLLVAADYYQLNLLKSFCEKELHKKLTINNAMETLQLADLYSAGTLKQLVLEFIKENWKLIIKTQGWSNVKSVELIKSICEYVTTDDLCERMISAVKIIKSNGTEAFQMQTDAQ